MKTDGGESDDRGRNDDPRTSFESRTTDTNEPQGTDSDDLRNVRGAVYLPRKDWNAYQFWANYENAVVERDLDYAADVGLNSLRVFASYECWREDGPQFFARVESFLSACATRDIQPLVVLFEAPPKAPPTEANLHATNPANAFGVHSPSRPKILHPRNWKGYDRSPIHFARRWAVEYAEDDRLLATEIMNEPGEVQPRQDFVFDALSEVRDAAPDATLTMGTKDVHFSNLYDRDGDLDAYQFHMNLPLDTRVAEEYAAGQRERANDPNKPIWCTEWQRTLDEPPVRFAPDLASLAPTVQSAREDATIDGDFFWSLMLRPAYLRNPREKGRINGLFHPDGSVYSTADAEAIAGDALDVREDRALPSEMEGHPFPYPSLSGVSGASSERPRSDAPSNGDTPSNSDTPSNPQTPNRDGSADALARLHRSLMERILDALGIGTTREDRRDR